MSSLQRRVEAMNFAPPIGSADFDAWLEQKDALAFLESNAQEDELILYASMRHIFIHAALVGASALDPINVDDLLGWSCNPSDTWGIWSSQNTVGLGAPLEHPGCETLKNGEQLVFTRYFERRMSQRSYVEALQKFVHVFGLHCVPERDAYCRIDKHGDVEELIRIVSMPSRGKLEGGRFVTFDRILLDEYMLLTDTVLSPRSVL